MTVARNCLAGGRDEVKSARIPFHGDSIQYVGMTQIAVWTKWKFIVQSEDEETGGTLGNDRASRNSGGVRGINRV